MLRPLFQEQYQEWRLPVLSSNNEKCFESDVSLQWLLELTSFISRRLYTHCIVGEEARQDQAESAFLILVSRNRIERQPSVAFDSL